jgi:hypothetical protein
MAASKTASGPSTDVGAAGARSTGLPHTGVPGSALMADTIHLDSNTFLQLFGDFKPTEELVRNKVRCIRVSTDGKTLLDVMLSHSEPIR